MNRGIAVLLALSCLTGLSVQGLAGAAGPAVPTSPSENVAVEKFLSQVEKPPVAYQRAAAPRSVQRKAEGIGVAGSCYAIQPDRGPDVFDRRARRVRADSPPRARTRCSKRSRRIRRTPNGVKGNLSRANYAFDFGGHAGDGMLKMQLTPRRRDSRLVLGSALADREIGKPRSCGRPPVEVAVILGALGGRVAHVFANRRRDDAGRRSNRLPTCASPACRLFR